MVRITDPEKSHSFYEALAASRAAWTSAATATWRRTNYFFSIGDDENVLELTYNHDGRTYDMGTAYGHIAIGSTTSTHARPVLRAGHRARASAYQVVEGGSRICFVRDPDR